MKRLGIFTLALLAAVSVVSAERPSVGLVLSGGGAKGVAHIGVIEALEENDIPIDYITGTSMGAIVGSLYAAGYSPAEMLALLASPGFAQWSTGHVDPADKYFFLEPRETPSFITINLGRDSTAVKSVLPMSLINPIPMNMAFPEIYSRFTAQCGADFEHLFVPFSCVTSDVYARHKVVLSSGSLADAVRMSMSFPMVFEPIDLDGVPMYDGGIYDNFPVDVMMEHYKPDVVVGVNVGSKDAPPTTRNPMAQLEQMIMQPNNYPFPFDKGVYIRIDLDEFSLLDFGKYQEIYDIGYRHGLAMVDSVRMKTGAGAPAAEVRKRRADFKSRTPEMVISKVEVTSGKPGVRRYLTQLFEPRRGATTLTFPEAKDAYYRAVSGGRLQNLVPTPVLNTDSTFTLKFKPVTKEDFSIGIGGYVSSSTSSMLFFHGGYNPLRFKGLDADVNLWVGQSYLGAEAVGAFYYNTIRPSALSLRLVATRRKYHETERLFYEFNSPDFINRSEVFTRLQYSVGPTRRSRIDAGLGYGHLTDKYVADLDDPGADSRKRDVWNLGQLFGRWERNTLDNLHAPTAGTRLIATAMGVAGRYHYDNPAPSDRLTRESRNLSWLQADLSALHFIPLGRQFALGLEGRALLSTRRLLPTYQASIVAAPASHPTPSTFNSFNSAFRANSFLSVDLQPVWKATSTFQVRADLHGFLPVRKILPARQGPGARWGRWLSDPEFFGELRAQLNLPFGTISAYGNYATGGEGWNFGISIGTFILAPKFLE
ncbi:MAG: patatin-like phospholipase family protein [Muribaculaceae bacterium]|nr:patatin-like phospholipase family protein [Muribaculaceae bacterium]